LIIVRTPCCNSNYCDECKLNIECVGVRRELLGEIDPATRMNCPNCKSILYPDSLIVNKDIRRKVEDHLRTAYSKRPTKGSNLVENNIKEEDLGSELKEENKNE
jgi:hypothetical protein